MKRGGRAIWVLGRPDAEGSSAENLLFELEKRSRRGSAEHEFSAHSFNAAALAISVCCSIYNLLLIYLIDGLLRTPSRQINFFHTPNRLSYSDGPSFGVKKRAT